MKKLTVALMPALVLLAGACQREGTPKPVATKPPLPAKAAPPAPAALPEVPPPVEEPVEEQAPPPSYAGLMHRARGLARRRPLDAVELYLQAAEARPGRAEPHIAISDLLIRQGEAKLARKHAETAVRLAPERSRSWNTLGRVELMDNRLAAAEEAFLAATRRNEDNIYAWNNLGLTRLKRKKYLEAVDALELATGGDKPKAYMFNNLGLALERLDRVDEALDAYKTGLALGSLGAGQNFVRLERELEQEHTAEITAVDPPSES